MNVGRKDFGRLVQETRVGSDGVARKVWVDPDKHKPQPRPARRAASAPARSAARKSTDARARWNSILERHTRLEKDLALQRKVHGGAAPMEEGTIIRVYAPGRKIGGMLGRVTALRGTEAIVQLANGESYTVPRESVTVAKSAAARALRASVFLSVRLARGNVRAWRELRKARQGWQKAGAKYWARVPTGNPKRPWRYYYSEAHYRAAMKRAERKDAHLLRAAHPPPANFEGKPEETPAAPTRAALEWVTLDRIVELDQYTKKADYDRETIDGLKASILANGYNPTFPIQVDRQGDDFAIVSGHHRFTALQELQKSGELPEGFQVPVIVQAFTSKSARMLAQIQENVRRTVKPTDEARAFGELFKAGYSAEELARKAGKSVGAVQRRLALNNLCPDLYRMVEKRQRGLPLGIAEAIGMHGLKADGTPNETVQLRAYRFYLDHKGRGFGAAEVVSYIAELKSHETQRLFAGDGRSETENEALRTVGNEEKAKRNAKLVDTFLGQLEKSFQRLLGDSVGELNANTMKELSASIVAAKGQTGFQRQMDHLGQVIADLQSVKSRLESSYAKLAQNAEEPGFNFEIAKAGRGAERSGHKYYRRVPRPQGGYDYYYSEEEYKQALAATPAWKDHKRSLQKDLSRIETRLVQHVEPAAVHHRQAIQQLRQRQRLLTNSPDAPQSSERMATRARTRYHARRLRSLKDASASAGELARHAAEAQRHKIESEIRKKFQPRLARIDAQIAALEPGGAKYLQIESRIRKNVEADYEDDAETDPAEIADQIAVDVEAEVDEERSQLEEARDALEDRIYDTVGARMQAVDAAIESMRERIRDRVETDAEAHIDARESALARYFNERWYAESDHSIDALRAARARAARTATRISRYYKERLARRNAPPGRTDTA